MFRKLHNGTSLLLLAAIIFLGIAISGCNEKAGSSSATNSVGAKNTTTISESKDEKTESTAEAISEQAKLKNEIEASSSTTVFQQKKVRGKNDKVVLFDTAHGEIFNLNDRTEMGFTSMRDIFVIKGYAVESNRSLFNDNILKGVKAVVVAGPMSQMNQQEADSLMRYLENGGNLMVTVHVSYFISNLTDVLGLQLSKSVLCQQTDTFERQPKNFVLKSVEEHPVMQNVKGIAVRATWAMQPLPGNPYEAKTIAFSAPNSWVDMSANDRYDIGEPRGSYGIIGVSTVGKGKVLIIGDDAVFTNFTINMASNRILCENIADWFLN
ncbi:MAG: hypothetical protein HY779_02040 [Rubrobacteridae bacterium]|nr:hypothetical protein [Rubrobacteridae bacterium]